MFAAAVTTLALASAAAAQMTIQVGAETTSTGGVYQYIPPTMTAANGTVVTFEFTGVPGNHSVTQSSFADPCTPLEGGFDSGWLLVLDKPAVTPTWNLTITNSSQPIWFFCKQLAPLTHCDAGMVGAINPPTSGANTFANFQANALKLTAASGQGVGGLVGIGASASANIGPISNDVTLFGTPTGTATSPGSTGTGSSSSGGSSSSSSGSGSATSPAPTSGAVSVGANFFTLGLAALAGLYLA